MERKIFRKIDYTLWMFTKLSFPKIFFQKYLRLPIKMKNIIFRLSTIIRYVSERKFLSLVIEIWKEKFSIYMR